MLGKGCPRSQEGPSSRPQDVPQGRDNHLHSDDADGQRDFPEKNTHTHKNHPVTQLGGGQGEGEGSNFSKENSLGSFICFVFNREHKWSHTEPVPSTKNQKSEFF